MPNPTPEPRGAQSLDQIIDRAFQGVADFADAIVMFEAPIAGVDVPLIVVWLIAGAAFFTAYLRLINVRGFAHAIRIVRGLEDEEGRRALGRAPRRRQFPREEQAMFDVWMTIVMAREVTRDYQPPPAA